MLIRHALLMAALLLTSACAHTPASQTPAALGDAAEGQRMAEIYCATCHAIGAHGDSPHPMAPPFRTLSRAYPVESLSEAFAEGILVGHPDMPEFRLAPTEIDDLLAYIESVQERRAS